MSRVITSLRTVFVVCAICFTAPRNALAQVVNPALGNWLTPAAGDPLGKGGLSGATLESTNPVSLGMDAGQTVDHGFFLHQETNAAREFIARVSPVTNPASTGTFGLMVRDSLEADSPFLFLGRKANGELVIYLRQKKGAPAAVVPLANQTGLPITDHQDLRLLVGGTTVYAFSSNARFVSNDTNANWHFLAAYSLPLDGLDHGGAFIDVGTATLSELHHTAPDILGESTTTADQIQVAEPSLWSRVPASALPEAAIPLSESVLKSSLGAGGASAEPITIPVTVYSNGDYHPIFHWANSSPAPVLVKILKGTQVVAEATVEQDPGPPSWHRIGSSPIPLVAGESLTFRVSGGTAQSGDVHLDAVRLFRTQRNDVKSANWVLQGNRTALNGTNNTGNAVVYRSSDVNQGWDSSGAYSAHALHGNGVVHFRVPRTTERVMFGLTEAPGGMANTTIQYRFFANNDAKASVNSEGTTPTVYSSTSIFSIERIGSQVLFRRDGNIIKVSARPTILPLYLDCSIRDHLGRVGLARIFGNFNVPNASTDKDSDGFADADEQRIVDADTDDEIHSIYDVLMSGTPDANGIYSWRVDPDQDGLTNAQELAKNTNPTLADTDGDGLLDGHEVNLHGTSPTLRDTDGDGLSDDYEVTSAYGFDPTKRFTINDGVSDYTRWEILAYDPNDTFSELGDVLPDADFDLDGVNNRHESADGTSAVNPNDWFRPVIFRSSLEPFAPEEIDEVGLFAHQEGSDVETDEIDGVKSTSVSRNPAVESLAGAISHHEIIDGSRLRFQFLPLGTTSGSADQVVVGFSHRGHPPYSSLPDAHYAAAIRLDPTGKARILTYGTELTAVAPIEVNESDIIELRLETGDDGAPPRLLHLEVIDSVTLTRESIAPIPLPAGAGGFDGFTWDHDKNTATDPVPAPLAVVVRLPAAGAGVKNLRYRGIHDPDSDGDRMADAWEQQIVDHVEGYTEVGQVLAGGDADDDDLLNLEEYELGTNPTEPDTDGDGMTDGWEVDNQLNPFVKDADGHGDNDGLTNLEEFRLGTRADLADTDGDGYDDGEEVASGSDPNDVADVPVLR